MFDDDSGRVLKFRGDAARRFQVHIVVVRKFLALELPRAGQSGDRLTGGNVKRRGLVGIFAVT